MNVIPYILSIFLFIEIVFILIYIFKKFKTWEVNYAYVALFLLLFIGLSLLYLVYKTYNIDSKLDKISEISDLLADYYDILRKDFNFLSLWNSDTFEVDIPKSGSITVYPRNSVESETIQRYVPFENFPLSTDSVLDKVSFSKDLFSVVYLGSENIDLQVNINFSVVNISNSNPLFSLLDIVVISLFLTDDESFTKTLANGGSIITATEIDTKYRSKIYINNGSFHGNINHVINMSPTKRYLIPVISFEGPNTSNIVIDSVLNPTKMTIDTFQMNLTEIVKSI